MFIVFGMGTWWNGLNRAIIERKICFFLVSLQHCSFPTENNFQSAFLCFMSSSVSFYIVPVAHVILCEWVILT